MTTLLPITALVDPSRVIACHCEDRQRFSGAPYRAVLPTPVGQMQMSGMSRHSM